MPAVSRLLFALLFAAALLAGTAGWAKPPKAKPKPTAADEKLPPPLTRYKGRVIAQTMHFTGAPWLVRESREREEECSTLLEVLDVQPGQVVCDFGCGNGFYTLPIAKK